MEAVSSSKRQISPIFVYTVDPSSDYGTIEVHWYSHRDAHGFNMCPVRVSADRSKDRRGVWPDSVVVDRCEIRPVAWQAGKHSDCPTDRR